MQDERTERSMHSLLPANLQDKTNLALEDCINKAFEIDLKPFVTSIIDKLPDSILYEKAKQFHLLDDGYNLCKTKEEKIRFVKNGIKMHQIKATKKCIKNLTDETVKYQDWYEYGGLNNHYKILIEPKDVKVDLTKVSEILKKIEKNKRLSAKQDNSDIVNTTQANTYMAARNYMEITAKPLPLEQ